MGETDRRPGSGRCGVDPALVCGRVFASGLPSDDSKARTGNCRLYVLLACLSEYGAADGAGEIARGMIMCPSSRSRYCCPKWPCSPCSENGGIGLRARGTSFDKGWGRCGGVW
jgi:hypothetical protein